MTTEIEEIDGKYVVTLIGEMDTPAAIKAEETLQQLYNIDGKDIIFDCTNLNYIASSGLRIIFRIFKGAKAKGSRVIMRGASENVKNVFRMTGFIGYFEFE